MATTKRTTKATPARPSRQRGTLAVDVGGSGVKAEVLADDGSALAERQRVEVVHPCPPEQLLGYIRELAGRLPRARRVGIGFPGLVRGGHILSAPNFINSAGPGSPVDPALERSWTGFDLAGAVHHELRLPTRVANDADVQGLAVVDGKGFELVVTLGTGFGTALFQDGELLPHLELAHHPFRKGEDYDEQVGDAARRQVGNERWTKRVVKALRVLKVVTQYDTVYIGGGNAQKLTASFTEKAVIVDNINGIRGALEIWAQRRVI